MLHIESLRGRSAAVALLVGLLLSIGIAAGLGAPTPTAADQLIASTSPVIPINLNTGTVPADATRQPGGMALDSNRLLLYTANNGTTATGGSVSVIDVDPTHITPPNDTYNKVVATIPTGRVGTRGIALSPDGTQVWLANFGSNGGVDTTGPASIQVIDTTNTTTTPYGSITGTLVFPASSSTPSGIPCSPTTTPCSVYAFYDVAVDGTHAWITASGASGSTYKNADLMGVYRIDRTFSGTVTGGCAASTACTFLHDGFSDVQPRGVEIVNGKVYVANFASSTSPGAPQFEVIDPTATPITTTAVTIPPGTGGSNTHSILGFTSNGNTLYLTDVGSGSRLQAYDTVGGSFSTPVTLGASALNPWFPAIATDDPATAANETRIYVPLLNTGGVATVTAPGVPNPVETLPGVGTSPYAVVISPDRKYAYVSLNANSNPGQVAVILLDQVPVFDDTVASPPTPPITPPAGPLPSGTVGVGYPSTVQVQAVNAVPTAITYSIVNEASAPLPPGLDIDSTTGKITGTPTEAGIWTFTVAATNGAVTVPNQTTRTFTITVYGPTNLAWKKVDGDEHLLQGATFTVTGPDDFSVQVTDNENGDDDPEDGKFLLSNVLSGSLSGADSGTFRITETTAPRGYLLNSTPLEAVVNANNVGSTIDADTVIDDPLLVYIRKRGIDATGTPVGMNGSEWQILADDNDSPGDPAQHVTITDLRNEEAGLFEVSGLAPGTYWLEETRALDGFALLAAPIKFVVTDDGHGTVGVALDTGATGVADADTRYPESLPPGTSSYPVIQVNDVPNATLPETGGPGLMGFWITGALVLAAAVGVAISRKKA